MTNEPFAEALLALIEFSDFSSKDTAESDFL